MIYVILEYAAFIMLAAALIVFGYFMVKRLDRFTAKKNNANDDTVTAVNFRIAVENPTFAPSICTAVESLSKSHKNCCVRLLTGTAEQIELGLNSGSIDVGVFLSDCNINEDNSIEIPLLQSKAYSDSLSAAFVPIEQQGVKLLIKRADNSQNSALADELLNLLNVH